MFVTLFQFGKSESVSADGVSCIFAGSTIDGARTQMTKHCQRSLAFMALFLSAFFSAFAATTAPRVVFLGDQITYGWTSAFAANKNWINQGVPVVGYPSAGDSASTLQRFRADVIDLHPAIVHIMIGSADAEEAHDATWRFFGPEFLTALDSMVKEARAAKIQVVLGLEPEDISFAGGAAGAAVQINSIIASYGVLNNIPVINYGDALCGCVGSSGATGTPSPYLGGTGGLPTAAGYALMTQMAEATIETMNLKLEGGYLQNVMQPNDNEEGSTTTPPSNVNGVGPAAVVQFTPLGHYSGGLTEPLINTNFAGSNGIWTSSNPLVMYINQQGLAWALSPGTAIITYTSPTGVKFSEWGMNIGDQYFPQ
jgi:lysophospholipase L1-like esterase